MLSLSHMGHIFYDFSSKILKILQLSLHNYMNFINLDHLQRNPVKASLDILRNWLKSATFNYYFYLRNGALCNSSVFPDMGQYPQGNGNEASHHDRGEDKVFLKVRIQGVIPRMSLRNGEGWEFRQGTYSFGHFHTCWSCDDGD